MKINTLSKNFKTYNLKITNSKLKIYKDNIEKPIIKHDGSIFTIEKDTVVEIEQIYIRNPKEILSDGIIELILPNNFNNEEFFISSVYGDINLKDLLLNKLIISLKHGDIKLENVDSYLTDIKLHYGDVIAEINESIFNYITKTNGICEQSTIESMNSNNIPVFLHNKHHLNINNTTMGDIKILFKGKR